MAGGHGGQGPLLSEYKNGIFSLASFTRESPKAVRYRLEPAGGREYPPLEQRQVYRSLGWDHVTTAGREMYVWRCDDPNAPELHTEPETEARAYDRLVRQYQRLDDYDPVDLAGVDEAWYTQTERYQSVFLRSGKQVLELSAQMDLRPYLQDCAALLAEKGAQS